MYSAAWSGKDFVTVGSVGTIQSSPDGVSWIWETSPVGTDLNGIVWFKNRFIAAGLFGIILTGS
jgi:hypothetical protein